MIIFLKFKMTRTDTYLCGYSLLILHICCQSLSLLLYYYYRTHTQNHMLCKIKALVYVPPTTAVTGYATVSEKRQLTNNIFVGAQMAVSL